MISSRGGWLLAALAAGAVLLSVSQAATESPEAPLASEPATPLSPEEQFGLAIQHLDAGQGRDALKQLEALTRQEPDNRIGRQIYGELLARLADEPAAGASDASPDAELQALAEEARVRLASEKAVPMKGTLPDNILSLSPLFKNAILVDLPRSRMYVFENKNGEIALSRHHYIGIGKNGYGKQSEGDQRTPVGVYHITGWKADKDLPELYGSGAFPLSYPNAWDIYKQRTGTGIWLHGVPREVYTRPPRSSEGCVTMANDDLIALRPYVTLGMTPVILSDKVEWIAPEQARADREAWLKRLETWRERWSKRDTESYLADYSPDFSADGLGFADFAAHKRRVNSSKKFIKVDIRDINLFKYPGVGDEPMVLAEFSQDYQSDNYKTVSRKLQFWRQDKEGNWKIFREENH